MDAPCNATIDTLLERPALVLRVRRSDMKGARCKDNFEEDPRGVKVCEGCLFIISAHSAAHTSESDDGDDVLHPIDYEPSPLSSTHLVAANGIMSEIPQIIVRKDQLFDANFHSVQIRLNSAFRLGRRGETQLGLGLPVTVFLKADSAGTAEASLIPRNTAMLDIIGYVGKVSIERNRVALSTVGATRTDAYLLSRGKPALVHVEENAADDGIDAALAELQQKFFASLPHYHADLQFIVGIAIAGSTVSFNAMHLHNLRTMTQLAVFDLSDPSQRLRCVRAAVNVGRWCKWALANNLVLSGTAFSRRIMHGDNALTFMPEGYVTKELRALDDEQSGWLRQFYTQIASGDNRRRVPHLETATRVKATEEALVLRLKPIGAAIAPRDARELQAAMRCVLECLEALHERGWAHLDLRWENVVWVGGDEWCVIDCEYARPFGSEMPLKLAVRDETAVTADAPADLYLVRLMLQLRELMWDNEGAAEELVALLHATPRETRLASAALQHRYFQLELPEQ